MTQSIKTKSKFLSLVLRHDPGSIGLALDAEGWENIDTLIDRAPFPLTHAEINEIVITSDKQRFALSADGNQIRANQGHSIAVDLGLVPQTPPTQLFHGTATRFVASILASGLQKQSRQHVHLSPDPETALQVGQRHGKPAIFRVDTAAMAPDHSFFQSENGVWLVDAVPVQFLTRLP